MINKKNAGFILGILLGLSIWMAPLAGLPEEGRKCLAMSLVAVVWWATNCMHPGYTSLALLLGYSLLLDPAIAPASLIFRIWTTPMLYLVVGGFLIAAAVSGSRLGERMALWLIYRFVNSYRGIIVFCYLMGFLLSFLIPHPWPRSFLILSVISHIIKEAGLEEKWAQNIGLAIFAGSVPTASILLTGDSILNTAATEFAGQSLSWLDWVIYMGVPGALASILTCLLQIKLFGEPPLGVSVNRNAIRGQLEQLGSLTLLEKKTIFIIGGAILLWAADSLHGIPVGWVALGAAILLSTPFVGALDAHSWQQVNPGTLFFLCAALSIGTVGAETGMNAWLAEIMLPSQAPTNPYIFALIAAGIGMTLHMVIGSSLAALGVVSPAIVAFGISAGLPPIVPAMIAYTAVTLHWLLPFHHMNLLIGLGENGGKYDEKMVFKLGFCQTGVIVVVVLFQVFWWSLIGVL